MSIDLFDLMKEKGIEVPKSIAGEKKKDAKKDSKKKKAAAPKKKEPLKFTIPFNVHYTGNVYEVTTEDIPDKEALLEEELLEHMRTKYGFRILKKERAVLEYDKEDNDVIIVLRNPSKGSSFSLGLKKYKFEDDAIRFVKCGQYGHIIGPSEDNLGQTIELKGLSGVPGVYLKKKVPSDILMEILKVFTANYPYEVLAQIYYDKHSDEYSLYFPEQNTTEIFVSRDFGKFYLVSKDVELFAEIHSHGDYKAVFSPIDDANELDFLIYGVIGELASRKPTYKFRIGFNGLFHEFEITDLFDLREVAHG